MRDIRIYLLIVSLGWLNGCAQDSHSTRKTVANDDEKPAKTSTKKDKTTTVKKEEESSDISFCGRGTSPGALKADPADTLLKIEGSPKSLCDLLKDNSNKVLLFQLVSSGCSGCADKVYRTSNFLTLSRVAGSIRHFALFSESSQPANSDLDALSVGTESIANDSKAVLAGSFSKSPEQDGTAFLLISSQGTLETFSDEQYLEAIKKAEDMARNADSSLSESNPDALKASSATWDGSSTRGNKRFALIATE
jgi:hypothetical protein